MKNSNGTVGNQNRDLPVCSALPQTTAPPRAYYLYYIHFNNNFNNGDILNFNVLQ
jgi:hypothetical protein